MRKTLIKKLARRELHHEPQLVEEVTRNGASLSIWRSACRLPSDSIAILELPTGRIFAMRRPSDVSRVLKAMGLRLADDGAIISLFERIRPGRRYPLLSIQDFFLIPPPPNWHPPRLMQDGLVFFSNNPNSGVIERISISANLTIRAENFAKGESFLRR